MDKDHSITDLKQNENAPDDGITYNIDKDFYKGLKGELRLKAEGLFKKAKEKIYPLKIFR